MVGQPLHGFITDMETRHIYDLLLHRVRKTGDAVVVTFRCDAPALRRFMELRVAPWSDGGVELDCRLVRREPREAVALLDPTHDRSSEFLTICSWCKRVRVGAAWVEVEEAVERLALFHADRLPQLTHGMCPGCMERVRRELGLPPGDE